MTRRLCSMGEYFVEGHTSTSARRPSSPEFHRLPAFTPRSDLSPQIGPPLPPAALEQTSRGSSAAPNVGAGDALLQVTTTNTPFATSSDDTRTIPEAQRLASRRRSRPENRRPPQGCTGVNAQGRLRARRNHSQPPISEHQGRRITEGFVTT